MTITYVGAGAAATGNNAGVTPALPAGIAVGDLLLAAVSIRNAGSGGHVATLAGWSNIGGNGFEINGRFYQAGDTAPTFTFTGGVTNADTIARLVAFRGVSPDVLTQVVDATQTNGSGQDIAYPALDLPGNAYAILMALWKQDDATSLTTPSGWTAVGLTNATAGDDALLAMFYRIETTEVDITSGSSAVTGGTAAISRALLFGLKPAAAITVTEHDVWPPRVQVAMTGLTLGDSVAIYREVAGVRSLVRGSTIASVTDTSYLVVDAELPFGVPVTYIGVVEGTAEYRSAATSYALPGGKVALTDAITGLAAEVVITGFGEQAYSRDSARLRVGGKNVVVTGPAGQVTGSYELYTETTSAHQNLLALLVSATEATVQVRQPGSSLLSGQPYDGVDAYLAVDAWTVRRFSQDGSDPRRLTTIEFAATDGWASALQARGFTYADLATRYAGLTYADLIFDYATYLDLAEADLS